MQTQLVTTTVAGWVCDDNVDAAPRHISLILGYRFDDLDRGRCPCWAPRHGHRRWQVGRLSLGGDDVRRLLPSLRTLAL